MASRIMLVEGTDDRHVMYALLKQHGLEKACSVEQMGGIEQLLEDVVVRLRTASDLERLAVVVDADEDIQARWQQIRASLARAGYDNVLQASDAGGTVVDLHDGKRFGVWVMPDNTLPGILENFVAFLVPRGDVLLPLVD
jgi:hypothetical protein